MALEQSLQVHRRALEVAGLEQACELVGDRDYIRRCLLICDVMWYCVDNSSNGQRKNEGVDLSRSLREWQHQSIRLHKT